MVFRSTPIPSITHHLVHGRRVFQNDAQALSLLGATHTAEIPFVFGNLDNFPLPNGNCSFNAAERSIGSQLIEAWTSMAASGTPNTSSLQWPLFTANETQGINVNSTSVFAGDIDYSICAQLWDKIDAGILQNSLNGTTNSTTCSGGTTSSPNSATSVVLHSGLFMMMVGMGLLLLA